jgi:hypothetical protein
VKISQPNKSFFDKSSRKLLQLEIFIRRSISPHKTSRLKLSKLKIFIRQISDKTFQTQTFSPHKSLRNFSAGKFTTRNISRRTSAKSFESQTSVISPTNIREFAENFSNSNFLQQIIWNLCEFAENFCVEFKTFFTKNFWSPKYLLDETFSNANIRETSRLKTITPIKISLGQSFQMKRFSPRGFCETSPSKSLRIRRKLLCSNFSNSTISPTKTSQNFVSWKYL